MILKGKLQLLIFKSGTWKQTNKREKKLLFDIVKEYSKHKRFGIETFNIKYGILLISLMGH